MAIHQGSGGTSLQDYTPIPTETPKRQALFWGVAFAVLVIALYVLRDILLPFIAGLGLAYFLNPPANRLQNHGLSRLAATIIILSLFLVLVIAALMIIVPVLGDQVTNLAGKLPGYMHLLVTRMRELMPPQLLNALTASDPKFSGSISDVAGKAARVLGSVFASIWSGGIALVNLVALIIVTPIVAFYMLNDWDRMIGKLDSWAPLRHAQTLRMLARQMDEAVAGFIRGQGMVCLSLGLFYAIALSAVGLDFGLLIGLLSGVLTFIPYAGSTFGGICSIGMALIQFWPDWGMIVLTIAIFVFGQFVEGNFLAPLLVGDRIGIHPVWLIFALFAFSYLFGFVGLLLAVPITACIGVVARHALAVYLASSFYTGRSATDKADPIPPTQTDGTRKKGS
ncbi:MAG: AI-2E family transporter [Hyphomicrobiales bacterium]